MGGDDETPYMLLIGDTIPRGSAGGRGGARGCEQAGLRVVGAGDDSSCKNISFLSLGLLFYETHQGMEEVCDLVTHLCLYVCTLKKVNQ
jgi:hypothetical protein